MYFPLQWIFLLPLTYAIPTTFTPPAITIAIGKDIVGHPNAELHVRDFQGVAQALTCAQLNQLNARIDEFTHHVYPSTVPGEKVTAVNGLAGAYKGLINALHRGDCIPHVSGGGSGGGTGSGGEGMKGGMLGMGRLVERQDDTDNEVVCLVIDALLGGEAGSGCDGATVEDNKMVKRQDDLDGIVEQILALVGSILQTVLGCGSDSGSQLY
ncbi:hypothetical protein BDV18DRAFT_161338 [Aspergillus unguis]